MKRYILTFALIMALPFAAKAQQGTPSLTVAPANTLLTVAAEGKSLRLPDVAMFTAGVATQGATAANALAENSSAMERVITGLRNAGIAERDIQTSNLSVEPIYSDPDREAAVAARRSGQPYVPADLPVPNIIGYRANNSVSVRQRDLKNFGRVIDTLVSAGANQVNGPSFNIDNLNPAMNDARVDALRQARERADLLAQAAGMRVNRILSISDGGSYFIGASVAFARGAVMGAPPPPTPPAPVQPGELQMTATMTVLFELSPN